jgi:hypothetical protein
MIKNAKVITESMDISDLFEFPGNPNEESAISFNNLISEIDKDGFDQPLLVVPRDNIEPGQPGYIVVSGNHRLKALKNLGYQKVDCVVKEWDAETSKIKVVRRNLLSGELNSKKFSSLVDSLDGYTNDQIADVMGFESMDEFNKVYQREVEQELQYSKACASNSDDSTNFIDGLSDLLHSLYKEYGDTVPYSFMYFLFGKKIHLALHTNTKLKKILETITLRCVENKWDINTVMTGLLSIGISSTNLESNEPKIAAIEQVAREFDDEEYELSAVTKTVDVVVTDDTEY